jgi:hypothetical protein
MQQELILKIHDSEPARESRAPIGPCSIGRGAENDVVIDAPGVSRRHAVIGNYSDGAQLSDCNSQNGTFVNGRRVVGTATLNNGDVVSIGGVCEITVITLAGDSQSKVTDGVTKPGTVSGNPSITGPLVAVASIAVIMVIAAVIIIERNRREPRPDVKTQSPTPSVFNPPSSPGDSAPSGGAPPLDRTENAVRRLMRRISKDSQVYDFPDESPLRDINVALGQSCKSASLAAALQTISRNRNEFINLAGNQITPDLLAYAVLAESDGAGAPQKLMDTARLMAPKLISLRNTFGDETADSVLIFVSAYPEGVFPRGGHPLLARIPADNPMRERKVWSLARRGKFKTGQYEFVLRFIAYGIIAGNPGQCGIALPKLDF